MGNSAFGDDLGARLRAEHARALICRSLQRSEMAVTEVRADNPPHGRSDSIPAEDAFLVGVQLRDYPEHHYWEEGRKASVTGLRAGDICLYDLKRDPIFFVNGPFHSLHLYLSRVTLDEVAAEAGGSRISELAYQPGQGVADAVALNLLRSLLPAFERPERASRLFLDHVTAALAIHVAHAYGGLVVNSRRGRGGLAPWQARLAKDMLTAHLNGDVSLTRIARECGLSAGHFARAFRTTTGAPPHRWLLERRIEKAKSLLQETTEPLADVATMSGFADQSHFTRTFSRMVGVSPGAWRRGDLA